MLQKQIISNEFAYDHILIKIRFITRTFRNRNQGFPIVRVNPKPTAVVMIIITAPTTVFSEASRNLRIAFYAVWMLPKVVPCGASAEYLLATRSTLQPRTSCTGITRGLVTKAAS